MWVFHLRSDDIKTPRSLTMLLFLTGISSKWNTEKLFFFEIVSCSHFSWARLNCRSLKNAQAEFKACCKSAASEEYIFMSSAKSEIDIDSDEILVISSIYSRNKRGPMTEPCGTPLRTGNGFEIEELTRTRWVRPVKRLGRCFLHHKIWLHQKV